MLESMKKIVENSTSSPVISNSGSMGKVDSGSASKVWFRRRCWSRRLEDGKRLRWCCGGGCWFGRRLFQIRYWGSGYNTSVFWRAIKSKVTNLVTDMAPYVVCPFRFGGRFTWFFVRAVVVIMSPLIAVNTKFVSLRDLALFAPHGGKGSFVGRIRSFCLLVFLMRLLSGGVSLEVPIIRRCVFIVGFSCLNTIQREKDVF